MDETRMDDLKQFIAAQVSQSEARLEENLGGRIDGVVVRIDDLAQEVRDGFQGVGDAIMTIHAKDEEQDDRLDKLEESVKTLAKIAA